MSATTSNPRTTNLLAIGGMGVTLMLAYGADYWLFRLSQALTLSLEFLPYTLVAAGANLLLASSLLGLYRLTHRPNYSRPTIAGFYVVAGLLISVAPALPFMWAALGQRLPSGLLIFALEYLSSNARVVYAGSFLVVIGLANLWAQQPPVAQGAPESASDQTTNINAKM